MLRKLGKKAQTTAEYAILIALIVGAVVAMQIYVKRGIQGRVKDVVDHTGSGGEVAGQNFSFSGGQYEPYYNQSTASTSQNSSSSDQMVAGGGAQRDNKTDVNVERTATTLSPDQQP
jgi:hypothetical protein